MNQHYIVTYETMIEHHQVNDFLVFNVVRTLNLALPQEEIIDYMILFI